MRKAAVTWIHRSLSFHPSTSPSGIPEWIFDNQINSKSNKVLGAHTFSHMVWADFDPKTTNTENWRTKN